jgi:hypothetical protein
MATDESLPRGQYSREQRRWQWHSLPETRKLVPTLQTNERRRVSATRVDIRNSFTDGLIDFATMNCGIPLNKKIIKGKPTLRSLFNSSDRELMKAIDLVNGYRHS